MRTKTIELFVLQMFHNVIFCLEILSTYMTRILISDDYLCGKEVSANESHGKVPDSANGSSQNNASFSLICCQALGRTAWNSISEKQWWHQTFRLYYIHHWLASGERSLANAKAQKNSTIKWLNSERAWTS